LLHGEWTVGAIDAIVRPQEAKYRGLSAKGGAIMATIASLAAHPVAPSPLASAANPPFRSSQRQSRAGDPATLFASFLLDPRAARLNTLADAASRAQEVDRARQVERLIDDARGLAERARHSASTVAQVTGTAPNMTSEARIEIDQDAVITVSDGETTAAYVHAAGNDVQDFLDAVNGTADLKIKASLTSDRWLRLEATDANPITVGGSADADELASIGLAAGTTVGSVNGARRELARAFDLLREQIDAVALRAGAPLTAEGLGIRRASGGGFQSDADVTAFLDDLEAAGKRIAEEFPAARSVTSQAAFARAAREVLTGGDDAEERDESGALGLARQVRAQFAATSHALAGPAAAQALRLFW
jgi:hypothetical protein